MAFPGSFPFSMEKNIPILSQDLGPDKSGCTMSCWEDETDLFFHMLLSGFSSRLLQMTFEGSAPVTHPHYCYTVHFSFWWDV